MCEIGRPDFYFSQIYVLFFHILKDKHRIKHWIPAHIPCQFKLIDKFFERVILVLKGFQCCLTHFLQILYEWLPALRARPKRQRVHKHAEYRLKILVRPAAIGERR